MPCRPLTLVLMVLAHPTGAQVVPGSVPDTLTAAGDRPLMTLTAEGVQVYRCQAAAAGAQPAWAFVEPRAELFSAGRPVGRHYAGPTWEHADGSAVTGRVTAQADAPKPDDDIRWLRLDVSARRNAGAFGDVAAIQRVNTLRRRPFGRLPRSRPPL